MWGPIEEESKRQTALELRNEDSSNRKRSSSLTEQSQKRRERVVSGHQSVLPHHPPGASRGTSAFDSKPALDKSLLIFHQELTETCIDFMARYAFADCSALPTRFVSTNFLLSGGLSQSWMLDNRIVTITTSGCTQKELRDGLCDKCYQICRKQQLPDDDGKERHDSGHSLGRSLSVRGVNDSGSSNSTSLANRRRHRSAFAGAGGGQQQQPAKRSENNSQSSKTISTGNERIETKDDLHLENKVSFVGLNESGDENMVGSSFGGSSPFISAFTSKIKVTI